MIEPVIFINALFGAIALIFGLCSRNFATAVVTGLFTGLVHAGLIGLVAAQAGATAVAELPYLKEAVDCAMSYKDGVDLVMSYVPLTVEQMRLAVYLATVVLATWIAMIAAYLVRWVLLSLLGLVLPKRATT